LLDPVVNHSADRLEELYPRVRQVLSHGRRNTQACPKQIEDFITKAALVSNAPICCALIGAFIDL
jgi:hypothetical protein